MYELLVVYRCAKKTKEQRKNVHLDQKATEHQYLSVMNITINVPYLLTLQYPERENKERQ